MVVKSIRWWKVWWEEFKQIFWGKIRDNPKRGKLNQLLWLCYPENASFAANSKCCWDKKKFFINFVGWQKFGSQIDYEVELAKVMWKQKPDLDNWIRSFGESWKFILISGVWKLSKRNKFVLKKSS